MSWEFATTMAIYKRGNVWYYHFQKNGKRYQASTGTSDRIKAAQIEIQAKEGVGKEHRLPRNGDISDPGVYFLQSPSTNVVKVGCSGNVTKRLANYETQNPESLILLARFPVTDYRKAEAVIHDF